MREKCPKTGKLIDKPDECAECEFLMVTIPAGWVCTYSSKAKKGARKRALEGYLYCIPYVGDRWVLTPKSYGTPPRDFKEFWKWRGMLDDERDVDELLDGLEGKKVRITVEVLEDTAGMMNLSARGKDDRRGDSDRHQKEKGGETR